MHSFAFREEALPAVGTCGFCFCSCVSCMFDIGQKPCRLQKSIVGKHSEVINLVEGSFQDPTGFAKARLELRNCW